MNVKLTRSGIQPLLPDDFGDEALAGIKFGEEFGNRYGGLLKFDMGSNWSRKTEVLNDTSHHTRSPTSSIFSWKSGRRPG